MLSHYEKTKLKLMAVKAVMDCGTEIDRKNPFEKAQLLFEWASYIEPVTDTQPPVERKRGRPRKVQETTDTPS